MTTPISLAEHHIPAIAKPGDRASALIELAKCYARGGDTLKSDSALNRAKETSLSITRLDYRVYQLAEIGRACVCLGNELNGLSTLGIAEGFVKKMNSPALESRAFSNLARIYADIGQKGHAVELLNEAVSRASTIEYGATRDGELGYTSVSYSLAGCAREAIEVTKRIGNRVEKANTIFVLIHFDVGEKEDKRSAEIMKVLLEVSKDAIPSEYNDDTLAKIAMEHARTGKYQRATELVKSIQGGFEKATCIEDLLENYPDAFLFDEINAIVDTIEKRGWAKSAQELRTSTLSRIGVLLSRAGRREDGVRAMDLALQNAEALEDAEEKAFMLAQISCRFASLGIKERAREVHKRALKLTDRIEDKDRKAYVLIHMADWFAEAGKYERAVALIDRIDDNRRRLRLLPSVAEWLVKSGHGDEAVKAMDLAFKEVRELHVREDIYENDDLFEAIAVGYARAGASDMAFKALDSATHGFKASRADRVVKVLLERGDLDGALRIADNVAHGLIHDSSDFLMNDLAIAFAKAGRMEHALDFADRIDSRSLKEGTLGDVAVVDAKEGRIERALSTIEMMDDPARKVYRLCEVSSLIAQKHAQKISR